MIAFYAQIKLVHLIAVLLSGSLFAVRGIGVLAGQRWPLAAPLRYLSYSVDTTLLTAALMLLTILPAGLFANGWLTLKLVLLVVYVVLGTLALKRGKTLRVRAISFFAALLTYGYMLGVARMHHPLGVFYPWVM
jgi:uncharacterized membrane protein SirB2